MKKILIVLLFLPLFSMSQDYTQYLPKIAWSTNLDNVVFINTDTFTVDVLPLDLSEPGAFPFKYGNYLMDNRGLRYLVIDTTASPTITVVDIFGAGFAPFQGKIGYVYQSAGNGDSHSLPTNMFEKLDTKAFDYGYRLDMNILWGQLFNPHDSIQYTLQSGLTHQEGKTFYDSIKHTLAYYNEIEGVTVNIGLENLIRIYNNTEDTIHNGIIVAPSGDQFGSPEIFLADSRYKDKSTLIAVATHDIPPLTFGWVTKFGEVGGLNTLAYAGVKFLYLNGDGEITITRPIGGHYETIVGSPGKIDATDGTIIVDIRTSAVTVEQQGYTGWPDADDNSFPDNVGLSLDGPTRTLILTATPGDEFYHYQDGEKYAFAADTFVYSNVEGIHLLYYDEGEITEIANPTDTESRQIKERYPGIMNIYHSLTFGTFIFVNNEFHTFDMNGKTKGALYDVHGCTIIEPILLVDFDIDGSGNSDSHAQYGNLSGTIRNEDIKTSVPATVSAEGYSIFYKDGTSAWLRATNAGFGVITTGTGRLAYNEDVGGSWQLSEATNGDYVYYLMLVSNTLGLKYGTIPGHASYADEQDAVDGGLADAATILQNLPVKEIAKVALVVYQTRDNYTNAVHGRIVSVTDPITGNDVDYIDLAIPGIGAGAGGSGANNFIDLGDVFTSYAGRGDDIMVVNSSEDGLTSIPKGNILLTDFDSTGFRLTQFQVIGLNDTVNNLRTDINTNTTNIQINADSITAHRTDINQNVSDISYIETNYFNKLNDDTDDITEGTTKLFDKTVSFSGGANVTIGGTYPAFVITDNSGTSNLALGETSVTAYRGDRGKIAYDHSLLVTGNPHAVLATQISDFDTEVSNNSSVVANTAKITNATHTGDATGATALTLATVNSNIGTYNNVTINAKGLATAGSNVAYEVPLTFSTGLTRAINTITTNDSEINHDGLLNYAIGQHRIINDAGTSATELWSASKINSTINTSVSGTTNYVSKFTGVNSIGNSLIYDDGTKLEVAGRVYQTGLGNSTYFGYGAGAIDDLSDNRNAGFGSQSLFYNTTGSYNTANGYRSLFYNTTGSYNTANGMQSLYSNTTGYYNTANGYQSLYYNTTGYYNTANGMQSLYSNTTGRYNTANGYQSGRYIISGAENETSSNSLYLGYDTRALADGGINEIVIGYNTHGAGSNSVVLGNDDITKTVLKGNVGIGFTTPLAKTAINGGLHVGGESDPGDNNLLVDGSIESVGTVTHAAATLGTQSLIKSQVEDASIDGDFSSLAIGGVPVVSNITTNLSEGTATTTTVDINSSDGTNATMVGADGTRAGLMTKAKFDEVEVNNAKISGINNHSGLTELDYASSGHTGFARTGGTNSFNGDQTLTNGNLWLTSGNIILASGNYMRLLGRPLAPTGQTSSVGDLWMSSVDKKIYFTTSTAEYDLTGGGGAPTDATYITQTANGTLTNEQALGSLSTGFMKSATTTGVVTTQAQISLASDVSGNLPVGNLNSGTSASASTFWRGDGIWAAPTGTSKWQTLTGAIAPATITDEVRVGSVADYGAYMFQVTGSAYLSASLIAAGDVSGNIINASSGFEGGYADLSSYLSVTGTSLMDGIFRIKERTTPASSTNYGTIYPKDDNNLYYLDESGVETNLLTSGGGEIDVYSGNLGASTSGWHSTSGTAISVSNKMVVANASIVFTDVNGNYLGLVKWVSCGTYDNGTPSIHYNKTYDSNPTNITVTPALSGSYLGVDISHTTGATIYFVLTSYFGDQL